jgi:hypothetical protein
MYTGGNFPVSTRLSGCYEVDPIFDEDRQALYRLLGMANLGFLRRPHEANNSKNSISLQERQILGTS